MRRSALVGLVLVLCVAGTAAAAGETSWRNKIKHVVVTMLENRSFDHVLGFLRRDNPDIDGLTGKEYNHVKASDPSSRRIFVDSNAVYVDPDPGHSLQATSEQIFGQQPPPAVLPDVAPMDGFAQNAIAKKIDPTAVMSMFNKTSLPVINTLAQEFGMIDRYFASIPGPTEVNRLFLHSGTSNGSAFNDIDLLTLGYPQETLFERLDKNNVTWRTYTSDLPTTLFFDYMRKRESLDRMKVLDDFLYDAKTGDLPQYSFVEPRYYDLYGVPAEDQHPSHDMAAGDLFVKKLYDALRSSPAWESTLFIITYDEHGGFFDHVPTPLTGVPNPDGLVSTDPPFNFTRLGVRVPCVLVSPWIPKGTVMHAPVSGQFEHSSIIRTVFELFDVPGHLTKRDAWAAPFSQVLSLDKPRTDCPESLPSPPSLRRVYSADYPMSELQESFYALMNVIVPTNEAHPETENEAACSINRRLAALLKRPELQEPLCNRA
eukprot:m.288336 g.288336  ORF g.288336 m.288336 type:complete len:486 (+) comp11952_c0_seq1:1207-2664(+)